MQNIAILHAYMHWSHIRAYVQAMRVPKYTQRGSTHICKLTRTKPYSCGLTHKIHVTITLQTPLLKKNSSTSCLNIKKYMAAFGSRTTHSYALKRYQILNHFFKTTYLGPAATIHTTMTS